MTFCTEDQLSRLFDAAESGHAILLFDEADSRPRSIKHSCDASHFMSECRCPRKQREREQMWRTLLPSRAARAENLDFRRLASELVMSGGYVKNAVLRVAFIAADAGAPIGTEHRWRAARSEYESMGKVTYQL